MAQRVNVAQLYRATGFEKKKASRKSQSEEKERKLQLKTLASRTRQSQNEQTKATGKRNTKAKRTAANNDMMTESVVLMSLWPRAINILISN